MACDAPYTNIYNLFIPYKTLSAVLHITSVYVGCDCMLGTQVDHDEGGGCSGVACDGGGG